MKNEKKKIMLLDGTGLVYRAYYAFISKPLTTTRGENTSAIFGFLKVLIQIIRDFMPDSMVVAFDISRKTFRQKLYAAYKAQREETPPDLKAQIPIIIEILRLMNIPVIELEDYEADDIIGTLSEKLKSKNEVYIVSGDKDLLQLVGGNVKAVRPQHGLSEINLLDRESVKASLGIYPEQIPDYLAIVGDSSDNIPGVKGIGEKGAVQLLNTYPSLEEIYNHLDEIKGAMKQKLIDSKENAFLSKELARIRFDLALDLEMVDRKLNLKDLLAPEVLKKLEHYQITSLIQEIKKISLQDRKEMERDLFPLEQESLSKTAKDLSGNYILITRKIELQELFKKIAEKKEFSLDTETTSPNPNEADLIGISISIEEGKGYFIPVLYPVEKDFDNSFLLREIKKVLEDESIKKIGQNIKYEIEVFKRIGVKIKGIAFDTMVAAYLINPTRTHNNLESLVLEYLGIKKKEYSEVLKNIDKKGKTLLDAPINDVVEYACGDADSALRLKNILFQLIRDFKLEKVFYELEMPLIPVLAEMEMNGVHIDIEHLKALSGELTKELKRLEERIYHLAGKSFNINSQQQLAKILFEDLGLEIIKKTEGGKPSTDEEVLNTLALIHPLPAEILQYRTYAKLKNTYVDALPELILQRTGRIHTSFNQTITATGRLSSSDPNLQNIPVRDEIGKKIREAFSAENGNLIISADYSQIELRILAHFCGDENMINAFKNNMDIHRHTASLIFNVKENDVTEEMRRRAKAVNFGIIYGLQAFGLSRQMGIPVGEAKEFIQSYFSNFPGVKCFIDRVLQEARETGEVRTLYGRYRKFPDLKGREFKDSDHLNPSQRMAINTKIQGSAADIIKVAMIRLQEYIEKTNSKSKLILQIHDELVLECPEEEVERIKKSVKEIMENAYPLNIPTTVDIGAGKNWAEAH